MEAQSIWCHPVRAETIKRVVVTELWCRDGVLANLGPIRLIIYEGAASQEVRLFF